MEQPGTCVKRSIEQRFSSVDTNFWILKRFSTTNSVVKDSSVPQWRMNESLSSIESFVESFMSNKNDTTSEVSFSGNNHDGSFSDPAREALNIQRNNLVLLLKLTIKNVFKHRVKSTVTPECKVYFEHLFILLEKTLQHGLKRKFVCFYSGLLWQFSLTVSIFYNSIPQYLIRT